MTKRLTDEEIIEIRKRVEDARKLPFITWGTSKLIEGDVPDLLAEIELLRKENHMYEQAVAEDDATKERLLDKIEKLQKNKSSLSQKYISTFISYCEMLNDHLPFWKEDCADEIKQLKEAIFISKQAESKNFYESSK